MPAKQNMLIAAKTLLIHNRKALLLLRSAASSSYPQIWEFPGGKLEHAESPLNAALRETQEETGIDATFGPILYAETSTSFDGHQAVVILYLATTTQQQVSLSFEHTDYLWATKSQMRELLPAFILNNFERHKVFSHPGVDIDE